MSHLPGQHPDCWGDDAVTIGAPAGMDRYVDDDGNTWVGIDLTKEDAGEQLDELFKSWGWEV